MVIVQGDTTTVFSGALTAFYHHIPVGHVEAGLRTGNMLSPWPEEANRVLTSRLAALHFAPTALSEKNLLDEGVATEKVVVTGNTVIDALFLALEKIKQAPPVIPDLPAFLQPTSALRPLTSDQPDFLQPTSLRAVDSAEPTSDLRPPTSDRDKPRLVLITGHRRENFGGGFEHICNAIVELAQRFPDVHFVYPMHLNPNVREPVERILGVKTEDSGQATEDGNAVQPKASSLKPSASNGNIHLIGPLQYLPFVAMMNRSHIILTDSGGVQEEAPSLGKPVLVMRDTTERPEAVDAGTVRLVGTDYNAIVNGVSELLTDQTVYDRMSRSHNPYGDGKATERHIHALEEYFGVIRSRKFNMGNIGLTLSYNHYSPVWARYEPLMTLVYY